MENSNDALMPDIIYAFSKEYMKERIRNALSEKFKGNDSISFRTSKLKDNNWEFDGINYKLNFEYGASKGIFVIDYNIKNIISDVFPMFGEDTDIKFVANNVAVKGNMDATDLTKYLLGELTPDNRKKFQTYFLKPRSVDFSFYPFIGNQKLDIDISQGIHKVQDCPLVPELTKVETEVTGGSFFKLQFSKFLGRICLCISRDDIKEYKNKYPTKHDIREELEKRYNEETYLKDSDTIALGILHASNYDYSKIENNLYFPHTVLSYDLDSNGGIPILPSLPIDNSNAHSIQNINQLQYKLNHFRDSNSVYGAYYVACNTNELPKELPNPEDFLGKDKLGNNANCTMTISKSKLECFFYERLKSYMHLFFRYADLKMGPFMALGKIHFGDNHVIYLNDYFGDKVGRILGKLMPDFKNFLLDFHMNIPDGNEYQKLHFQLKPYIYKSRDKIIDKKLVKGKSMLLFAFVRMDLDTNFGTADKFVKAFYLGLQTIFVEDKRAERKEEIPDDQLTNFVQLELHKNIPEALIFGDDIIPKQHSFINENLSINFVKRD